MVYIISNKLESTSTIPKIRVEVATQPNHKKMLFGLSHESQSSNHTTKCVALYKKGKSKIKHIGTHYCEEEGDSILFGQKVV